MKIIVVLIISNALGWIIGTLLVKKLINEYKNSRRVDRTTPNIPTENITSIFVTPRLPVTVTPDLQYCIKSGTAFMLKSEYITTMTNSNITEYAIHIPYIDGSDVKYIHKLISSDGDCPSLDEVWSEEYVDALNTNIAYSTYQNVINELIMSIRYANVNETDIHKLVDIIDHNRNINIPTSDDEVAIQSVLITTLPHDIDQAIKLASQTRKDYRLVIDAFKYPKYRILLSMYKKGL